MHKLLHEKAHALDVILNILMTLQHETRDTLLISLKYQCILFYLEMYVSFTKCQNSSQSNRVSGGFLL
jgi:hypothetical protein